jgi:tripartite-type tricarboxylate transporter receptor subunit TctC
MMKQAILAAAFCLGVACAAPSPASAAAADQFYAGRHLTMYLSAGAGGIYTAYATAFAPHFSAHIPGKPRVIVDYMNGAGGLRAMNFLNATAPRDGSVIGLVHASLPFAPLYGIQGARFDAMKMNWIGAMDSSPGICVAWHQSPIKVWDDLFKREFIVGGSGAGSQMEILPHVINSGAGGIGQGRTYAPGAAARVVADGYVRADRCTAGRAARTRRHFARRIPGNDAGPQVPCRSRALEARRRGGQQPTACRPGPLRLPERP